MWSVRDRVSGLDGTTNGMSWDTIRFTLCQGQTNRKRYQKLFEKIAIPKILLPSRRAVERFCRAVMIEVGVSALRPSGSISPIPDVAN